LSNASFPEREANLAVSRARLKDFWINTLSVVADSQPKVPRSQRGHVLCLPRALGNLSLHRRESLGFLLKQSLTFFVSRFVWLENDDNLLEHS